MKSYIIQFLSRAGLFCSIIFVPIIIQEDFNGSDLDVGIIIAIYSFAVFISMITFGRLSDIKGRRKFLRIGLFASSITFFIQIFAYDTVSFAVLRFIAGLCAGIFPASLIAYVYESKKLMGKFASFGSLGWSFGSIIAGYIAVIWYTQSVFIFSSLFFFISFLISLRLPKIERVTIKVPLFPKKLIKKNMSVYSGIFIRHSGATMIWVFFPNYILDLGASKLWIGIIYAINMGTQFFVMFFITDKVKSKTLMQIGFILSSITFFSFTLARDYIEILPTQIPLAFSWAFLYVGSLKFVTEKNIERATASGFLESILRLSTIFGAMVGGILASFYGRNGVIYIASIMAIIAYISFNYFEKTNHDKKITTVK